MPLPKIVTQYDYENFERPGISFPANDKNSRSKTIQADMDAADINKIMARYEKTGVIIDASGVERKPVYGDFTEVKSYHETLGAVRRAEEAFSKLPVNVRNRFENDPQKLIDFLEDPKNNKEAVSLGLKDYDVLRTELGADGVTKMTPEEKASEAQKIAEAAAAAAAKPA